MAPNLAELSVLFCSHDCFPTMSIFLCLSVASPCLVYQARTGVAKVLSILHGSVSSSLWMSRFNSSAFYQLPRWEGIVWLACFWSHWEAGKCYLLLICSLHTLSSEVVKSFRVIFPGANNAQSYQRGTGVCKVCYIDKMTLYPGEPWRWSKVDSWACSMTELEHPHYCCVFYFCDIFWDLSTSLFRSVNSLVLQMFLSYLFFMLVETGWLCSWRCLIFWLATEAAGCFTINKLSVLLWIGWSSLNLETKTQEKLVILDNECLLDANLTNVS